MCKVHEDLEITITMQPRTTGAINLGPTGNIQGTHRLLSLKTGETIIRRKWTELPVPDDVIDRLKEISGDADDIEMANFISDDRDENLNITDKNELTEMNNPSDEEEIQIVNEEENMFTEEAQIMEDQNEIEKQSKVEEVPQILETNHEVEMYRMFQLKLTTTICDYLEIQFILISSPFCQ
jgi:hypothetical protein